LSRPPARNLVVPSPDLSQLLPVTSELVASNDPIAAPGEPQSNASPAAELMLNDQPGGANAPQEAAPKPNCAPPKLLNSLPMENVPGSDLMTVTATIDERPEKLLVDTGTMPTQVWKARAANLDLPVQEGTRYMDLGGRSSEDVTRVGRFDLGSMETGGFYVRISSDPDFSHAAFDGILGASMMHQYDIDLDFAHHRLNYFSPEQCKGTGIYWAPSTISSVHMLSVWGLIYVPVTLDGHTFAARLDTGADRTFLNPDVAQKLFGLKSNSAEAGSVTDGGALIKASMHVFTRLTLGGLTANNPQIGIPPSTLTSKMLPDLVIGMDLLKHSHLYISIQNQRIYVSAAGDGPPLRTPALSPTYFNVWPYPWYETWFRAQDDSSPRPLQR
jgi:predicted aspartyl protease